MIVQNVTFAGRKNLEAKEKKIDIQPDKTTQKTDGKSKLKKTLIALGIAAAAGIGIGVVLKNRKISGLNKVSGKIGKIAAGVTGIGLGTAAAGFSSDAAKKEKELVQKPQEYNKPDIFFEPESVVIAESQEPFEFESENEENELADTTKNFGFNTYVKNDDDLDIQKEETEEEVIEKEEVIEDDVEKNINEEIQEEPEIIQYEDSEAEIQDNKNESIKQEISENVLNPENNDIDKNEDKYTEFDDVFSNQAQDILKDFPEQIPLKPFGDNVEFDNIEEDDLNEVTSSFVEEKNENKTSSKPVYRGIEYIINDNDSDRDREVSSDEKIVKATKEYQERISKKLSLIDRIKKINSEKTEESSKPRLSLIRKMQLNMLPNELMNALDDETIDSLLNNPYGGEKLSHMGFLKTVTPEDLIKIQCNDDKRHAMYQVLLHDPRGMMLEYFMGIIRRYN